MKKEKLVEILVEMMATSPCRDWGAEAHSTRREIEKMRNRNLNHIDFFANTILEVIKSSPKK